MSLDYPHYAVELAVALAIGLAILFGLMTLWIIANRAGVICWLFGHRQEPFGVPHDGVDCCARCDSHQKE